MPIAAPTARDATKLTVRRGTDATGDTKALDAYALKVGIEDGKRLVRYATGLEAVLAAIFLCHIVLAVLVTLENRRARPRGYAVSASTGEATIARSS